MTKDIEELPPLTHDDIVEWLGRLEDIATITRDSEYATRALLINMLVMLDRSKALDAKALLENMAHIIPSADGENYKLSLRSLIDECRQSLEESAGGQPLH